MTLIIYELTYDADGNTVEDTDLTSLLLDFVWREGFEEDYAPMASVGEIEFKLRNDGRFVQSSSSYVAGRRIKLRAKVGTGGAWVDQVRAVSVSFELDKTERVCTLRCARFVDNLKVVDAASVGDLLYQTLQTDDLVAALLERVAFSVPYAGYFILNQSRLDGTGRLAPGGLSYDIGAGQLTITITGGDWDQESVWSVVRDLTIAEYGRFWIARDGKYTWRGRLYLQALNKTVTATIGSAELWDAEYTYPAPYYKKITVFATPRYVGTIAEQVASLDASVRVPKQATRVVRLPYVDAYGNKVSALDVGSLTFSASAFGVDRSASIGTSLVDRGTDALITFSNPLTMDVYIDDLSLMGKVVANYHPVAMTAENTGKPYALEKTVNASLLDDVEQAQSYANYLARFFGVERGKLAYIELRADNDTLAGHIVNRYLLERVSVTYGTDTTEYYIRMIESKPGWVRWWLELADTTQYFILNHATYGKLNGTNRLGW